MINLRIIGERERKEDIVKYRFNDLFNDLAELARNGENCFASNFAARENEKLRVQNAHR